MTTTLVALPTDLCPSCGTDLVATEWAQPTLFIGNGHGGTTAAVLRSCPGCKWSLPATLSTVNPRR